MSGREADFDNDSTVIAEVGSHRAAPGVLPGGGRLIKSHEPYSGPQKRVYRKAIYLIRDGRDVAVSYYYTLIRRGLYEGDFGPFLRLFLAGGVDGYGPWHEHVESWLDSPLQRARLAARPQIRGLLARAGREPVGGDGVPRRARRSRAGRGDGSRLQRRADAESESGSPAFTTKQKRQGHHVRAHGRARRLGPRHSRRRTRSCSRGSRAGSRAAGSMPAWSTPMRILMVNKYAHVTGGADLNCLELAELLRARGHEVAMLSTASPENVVRRRRVHRRLGDPRARARTSARVERLEVARRAIWNPERGGRRCAG